jgi:hypothetical protein
LWRRTPDSSRDRQRTAVRGGWLWCVASWPASAGSPTDGEIAERRTTGRRRVSNSWADEPITNQPCGEPAMTWCLTTGDRGADLLASLAVLTWAVVGVGRSVRPGPDRAVTAHAAGRRRFGPPLIGALAGSGRPGRRAPGRWVARLAGRAAEPCPAVAVAGPAGVLTCPSWSSGRWSSRPCGR